MNTKRFRKMVVLAVVLVCISAGSVWAGNLGLQEKLSKNINIKLKDVTIAEVLEKIGEKAGVKFILSDEAIWKLPQAEATRLSVVLDGPLAESVTEMLNAFFMRYAVGREAITIYPRSELEHILGRPTAKQLELLKAIYTRAICVYHLDEVQRSINEALGQEVLISPIDVQAQLNNLLRSLAGKDLISEKTDRGRPSPKGVIKKAIEQEPSEPEPTIFYLPTPVTLVQLLGQVRIERNEPRYTRWHISGMDFAGQSPEIRVLDSSTFRGLKLNQKIDISYKDERLDKILQNLASWAGVPLIVSRRSDLHEYTLSVNMQNTTIEQAVRNIAGIVGAQCEVRGDISISGPGPKGKTPVTRPARTPSKTGGEGYVGKISIPMDGGKYYIEFMLRENDLTDELKKLREKKMKDILGEKESKPKVKSKSGD